MKKFILLLSTIIACNIAQAQFSVDFLKKGKEVMLKKGSLAFLGEKDNVNFIFDYSDMIIKGLSEEDFLDSKNKDSEWREYWENDVKNDLKMKFVSGFNTTMAKTSLTLRSRENSFADVIATVRILDVDNSGGTSAMILFSERGSKKVMAEVAVFGRGGAIGSLENLMGDAYTRAGKKLADLIKKSL